jgi:hypothetical protein
MTAPVFIVGTGRCGSTLLSSMLREHAAVLSLSEFFSFTTDLGGRIRGSFAPGTVDASRFASVVCGTPPKLSLLRRHGLLMDEMLYRPVPGGRFSAEHGVPALLETTLPHLVPGADALFDEVSAFVATLPPAPMAEQYRSLFGWLTQRCAKRTWVERSGGSLRIVSRLRSAFPEARFVHIVRDGRDAALSMSRHYGFRMALIAVQLTEILGVDPYESPNRDAEQDLPDELVPFLPEHFDAEAFRSYETPPVLCAHYWSGECMAGAVELAAVPAERLLTLRYEDLLARPAAMLERLLTFIDPELVDPEWTRRVAATVRAPRSTHKDLPPPVLRELSEACRPGFEALGELYADALG